ncbi:MAG: hypothetical protein R6W97_09585 [Thiobacillus sp.]
MAIPWLAVLKIVPWTDVINNAPKVADGARKLWNAVGKKAPASMPHPEPVEHAVPGENPDMATLQVQIASLENAATEFHDQMLASSELIKTLADQNTQLVKRIETHRVRLAWLTGATAILAMVVLILIFLR